MDPFTIAAAIAIIGTIVVAILVISVAKFIQWFKAREQIKAGHKNVVAFTLAQRINEKKYVEVPGVFDKSPTNTQIVQGFYDTENDTILDYRAMASSSAPEDEEVQRLHSEGDGLVIYR